MWYARRKNNPTSHIIITVKKSLMRKCSNEEHIHITKEAAKMNDCS